MTHVTPLDYGFWLAQFLLELTIVILAFRRGLSVLWANGFVRMVFDVITFAALMSYPRFYGYVFYLTSPMKYALQAILAAACIREMVKESQLVMKATAAVLCTLATVSPIAWYGMGEFTRTRFLNAEISVDMLFAILLVVGLAPGWPKKPWGLVTAGFLILAGGDSLGGFLTEHFPHWWDLVARMYPVLEIGALAAWVGAGIQAGKLEARIPLGRVYVVTEKVLTRVV